MLKMEFGRGKYLVKLALEQNKEEKAIFADSKSIKPLQLQPVTTENLVLDQVIKVPDNGILEMSAYCATELLAETLDPIINDNSQEILATSDGSCTNSSSPLTTYIEMQNVVVDSLDQVKETPEKTCVLEATDTFNNAPLESGTLEFHVIPDHIGVSSDLDMYNDNSDDDPNYLPNSVAGSDSAGSCSDDDNEKVEMNNVKRRVQSNESRDSDIENVPAKRKKCRTSIKERKQIRLENEKKKHEVKTPCKDTCQRKCTNKFSEIWRKELNIRYWNMTWTEKRIYVSNSVSRGDVKRRRIISERSQRNNTFSYYMKTNSGEKEEVCKVFFLTTLGYKPKNDRIITYTLKADSSGTQTAPPGNRRGKHRKTPIIDRDLIKAHIETFNPSVSHYRREHAPNRRYLPSDITIKLMYSHLLETYPNLKVSYEFYRKIVTDDMNISFTTLGHEECEICESFKLHNTEHTSKNLIHTCDECTRWKQHIDMAKEARAKYREDAEFDWGKTTTVCFSADLEKVIMLPRMEMFKRVLFSQRVIVFNESFVPVGKTQNLKPFAVLWHEAISGRKKEDLISTFHAFLLHTRDVEEVIIWMDNCAGQNKNWTLFTYLIYIINSMEISANKIVFRYFEPGHTYMAADSFHHQVELSLKRKKKVYDFKDFTTCVQSANSGKVDIKEMTVSDFFMWPNGTSTYRIQNMKPRPYLKDIIEITAERGKHSLIYKTSFLPTATTHELNFLQVKFLKNGLVKPKPNEKPRGITQERKDSVLNNLSSIMPQNRVGFWKSLSVNNDSCSLINNYDDN